MLIVVREHTYLPPQVTWNITFRVQVESLEYFAWEKDTVRRLNTAKDLLARVEVIERSSFWIPHFFLSDWCKRSKYGLADIDKSGWWYKVLYT